MMANDCERSDEEHCGASIVSPTPMSRRHGQQRDMTLMTTTSPRTPYASHSSLSCSHALTLDVASRCSCISTPALLGYTAAHTLLLSTRQDVVAARLFCRADDSGSVEVRLEPTHLNIGQCTDQLLSLKQPAFLAPSSLEAPVIGEDASLRTLGCVSGAQEQVCKAMSGLHCHPISGEVPESVRSCQISADRFPSKPRVAGLWLSLADLPLSPSSRAPSTSWPLSSHRTFLGTEKISTSSVSATLCSPKPSNLPATPYLSKCPPCGLPCVTAQSTSTPDESVAHLSDVPLAPQSFSASEDHFESTAAMHGLAAEVSQPSAASAADALLRTASVHTPPQLPKATSESQHDTASSFEFTSKMSPDSDHEPGHAESCADEQCEQCDNDSDCIIAPLSAHPVSLLSSSLQNVVSPPLSSIDGDEGGYSGPLHGGTALGALDSVDGAVTDNGNNSEVEPSGISEPGGVSAPPSITGPLVDAAEQRDTVVSDGKDQFAEQFAQIAESAAAAAIADDSDCGCDEDCDGIDGASNDLEAEVTHAPGSLTSACDEGEANGYSAELALQHQPCTTPGWRDTAAGVEDDCDCTGFMNTEAPHISQQPEGKHSAGQVWSTSEEEIRICGDNDVEGSMHGGSASASNTIDVDRCHNRISEEPSGHKYGSTDIEFQTSKTGPRATLSTSNSTGTALPYALVPGEPAPACHLASACAHVHRATASQHGRPGVSITMCQFNTAPPLPPLPPLPPHLGPPSTDDAVAVTTGVFSSCAPMEAGIAASAGSSMLVPPELPPLLPAASSSTQGHDSNVQLSNLHAARSIFAGSCSFAVQPAVERSAPEEVPAPYSPIVRSPSVEDPPDLPIRSSGSSFSLFSLLDQHLLDRILLHVSATNSLNPAANVCQRFRNAVRRVAGSATLLPSPSSTPPVDPATGALDLRPLRHFPGLHTLRLPKFDRMRRIEVLPVELFRLRMLTQLTYLDIQCAAYVPTFQPLRLLPALRHLSCAGASLNPPPDLPELPNCEVMLYANRGLSAASRRNVLATLPPLSGLRVPSKAPAALLQQIGSSPSMRTLTYLRLGSCTSPALDPLSPLTQLVRLHLHVMNGHVTPLTTLSMLTYLHLHGHVDDLAVALGSFRKLQKLSLIKCKRLRADEVRAVGTLNALTSLELPCSKASSPPRDIRPLGRLKNLQHLSLAMPESGIAPLTRLTALTFLRLKYRAPDEDHPPRASRLALTASLFSMHLAVTACSPAVRVFSNGSGSNGGGGAPNPQASMLSASMGSVMQSASQAAISTAVTLAGAAAFPLAAYATRRAWTAVTQSLFPPALDAGRLADLCHMTQLEWLEVKSSTMPTPEEWSAALRPLTRLRRLDVRNTSFREPLALQDMPCLRVVLISGCTGLPRSNRALQEAASLRDDVEIRR